MIPHILDIRAYLWIGLFFLLSIPGLLLGQNQKNADSLIQVYNAGEHSVEVKFELLRQIAYTSTKTTDKLLYANESIKLAQEYKNDNWLMRGYMQKGNALRLKGDLEGAIDAYFKSAAAAKRIDYQPGMGGAYLSIGATYANGNDHRKAINFRNRAIGILRAASDSLGLATALLNTGYGYYMIDELDSALTLYAESKRIFEIKEKKKQTPAPEKPVKR